MHTDFGYFEEKKLGKPYDVTLLKRLYPYTLPYRLLLLFSIILVVLITLLDLSLPYITKIAIDRYIVPQTESAVTQPPDSPENTIRYLEADITDPAILAIVNKYSDRFEINDSLARISFDDLSQIRKKDLGAMAMTYGYVYVAQVAMGANQSQFLKAVREAEAFPGPSVIIAYSPCISHGLQLGMGKTQEQEKKAVEAGYWHLYRFDPRLKEEGKNPFQLDSKEPDWDKFGQFLKGEVRYTSLHQAFPAEAEILTKEALKNAKWRYESYKRLASMDFSISE